jgi:hypothetical protein
MTDSVAFTSVSKKTSAGRALSKLARNINGTAMRLDDLLANH